MKMQPMRPSPFRQTNAFAMNYAIPFGLWWTAGLLCFVHSMQYPLLSVFFYLSFASSPIVGYLLLVKFRNRVCGGVISFGRGYLFSLLTYFYAALLLAVACYVYFAFFDNGAFIDGYLKALEAPEVKQAFEQGGLKEITGGNGLSDFKRTLEAVQSASPAVYAANILDINIFLGLLLSIPASMLAMRREKGERNAK